MDASMQINKSVKINHPLADRISIQDSKFHHCVPGVSSEVAFFKGNEFVVTPIEPFADYHDGSPADASTAVYDYVPNELIDAFLQENRCE